MNYSLLLLVFFVFVPYIHGTISDWRLCGDPECRGKCRFQVFLTYAKLTVYDVTFSSLSLTSEMFQR